MANPYEIAIHLSMQNTVSPVLAIIAKDMLGLQMSAEKLEKAFARVGTGLKLAAGGAVGVFAGFELGKGVADIVHAGGELVKQQIALRGMGNGTVTEAEIVQATFLAQLDTQKVIGTTIAENLKGIREMIGVMPNLKSAEDAYPIVMQAAKVLEFYTGEKAESNLQTIAKAVELRGGGTDPVTHQLSEERFVNETKAFEKAIEASGGLVNAAKMLQLVTMAGPMAKMVNDPNVFYQNMLTAIMDMGGFRAGTGLTALGRQFLGGKMSAPTAEELETMGILKPGQWHKAGTGVVTNPGAFLGEDQLKDPAQGIVPWLNDVFVPALALHGIKSQDAVMVELYKIFGTETGRRLGGLYMTNQEQVKRDANLYRNASTEGYQDIAKGDWDSNVKDMHTAITNLMQALGAPAVQAGVDMMHKISVGINQLAGMALANPGVAEMLVKGAAALAGGLIIFGSAAVLAGIATLMGPWGLAVTALVTGIGYLAATHPEEAAKAMAVISEQVKFFVSDMSEIGNGIVTAVNAIVSAYDKVKGMLESIGVIAPSTASGALHSVNTRQDLPYLKHQDLQGIGNEVKPAPIVIPAPVVNVKATTTVNIDGKNIPASSVTRVVNTSAGHDGQESPAYPDFYGNQ